MRTAIIRKEELIERLEKRFGKNEPIFVKEIMEEWSEYSRSRVFQLIEALRDDGKLIKKIPGVYYLPKDAVWGGVFSLETMKIVERRYLKDDGNVFGYYTGQTLMNQAGFSNQVPNTREIVTTKETTRVRTVTINKFKVILRRAKIEINEKNAPVMQLLEIFNRYDRPVAKYQLENLIALTGGKIDEDVLTECAKCFPKRALQNLKNSGVYDVLA
jgi:hypothetical protein